MGLLDNFNFNMNDPQQAGLLGAALQVMQASGPSLMPTSLGQIMTKGYGGFQQGQQNAMLQQMNGIKLKDAQSDLANQDMLRERQRQIQAELLKLNAGGVTGQPQATPMPGPQSASAVFQGLMGGAAPGATPPPMQPAMPAAQPQNMTDATAQRLMREAEVYAKYGDFDSANKRYEAAIKLRPKYATEFRPATGADGKLHNYMVADDGTFKDAGVGVKPEMTEVDLGGTKQFVDKNGVTNGQTFGKTMTFADKNSAARLKFDQDQADHNQDAVMDPLAVRMTAQQYLAGDSGALQNFGRGAQGAANLNAVRLEVAKQANAAGMSGADIAAKMAEFGGLKAGQRTAGTRSASIEIAANEVAQLAPIALTASAKVARSGFVPFGKAQIMFDSNTNDPDMRQFAMANTALVNAYGQAMARGGAATVSDKDHARELLSTTFDQPSYAAAVEQLQKETRAAQAAPKQVRKDLSDAAAGRDPAPAPMSGPKVATLSDIAATARASGKTTAEVTAALRAKGYTIGGQ